MKKDIILGYDLNEKYCQISFYDETKEEPETLETETDNYQIPLMLGYYKEKWVYGKEAKRLAALQEGITVTDIFEKAVRQEKVKVGSRKRDGVWLLAKFIKLTLEEYDEISFLTFSVPYTNIDMSKMLKGIGHYLGIPKERVCVQDYKESFCQYMFYQPKELWQYESALFYCDAKEIRAYMLRRLNAIGVKERELFVTVEEVANAQMRELAAIYPILNKDQAKDADDRFKTFIQSVFEKKVVSSVYLTGEGFENNWYPNSRRTLCNGRRAFQGNNLYSKGACYAAYNKAVEHLDGPVYLDETKMTEQICLKLRVKGVDEWHPIVSWGTRWYEGDRQFEILLEDTEDIEIHVESLMNRDMEVMKIPLEGLPKRGNYTLRLQVSVIFIDEKTCRITWKDVGFGAFFEPSGFQTETVIHLGGSNGQFNSLS